MSRSILVIADEHEHKECSLEKAHEIVAPLNASLEIVRFLSHLDSQDELQRKQILAQAKKTLEQDVSDIFGDAARANCDVIATDAIADWVVGTCKQKNFDLVVKTGHRTENIFHTPTDWQLIRQLTCPVFIANNHKWNSKRVVLATVDIATHESRHQELNQLVLQWLHLLTDVSDCTAHVLYSIPIAKPLLDLDIVEKRTVLQNKQPEAEVQLAKLLEQFNLGHARTHITAGPPDKTIPHIANELKADLVIMGSVGRKGLPGFVIGNIAEKVLHHLRTDALIVEAGGIEVENSLRQLSSASLD